MDSMLRYQKSFLIFDEDDSGFGAGQRPSGHVKIEIRDGKGKLFCQVSNLTEESGKTRYKLFLVKADGLTAVPVLAGDIVLRGTKGELEWCFDPNDVSSTGITLDKFNVFAVLASSDDQQNRTLACPLVVYKGNKVQWRQNLNNVLIEQKFYKEILNQNQKFDDIYIKQEEVVVENNIDKEEGANKATKPDEKKKSGTGADDVGKENEIIPLQEHVAPENNKPEPQNEKEPEGENSFKNAEENAADGNKEEALPENQEVDYNNVETLSESKEEDEAKGKSYSSFDGSKLLDMNAVTNDNINFNSNCMNCMFFNNKSAGKNQKKEFGYEELSRQFDVTFERYYPFLVKRSDYIWWKVASPVHLNNILFTFGIKIPVLFNPLVLMAHYKYKHLIVGLYRDGQRDKDYVVCGIPGVYWVDEKPFGNACRWAQVEGNTPTYGAFGYWIVFINPKTGKILAVEE